MTMAKETKNGPKLVQYGVWVTDPHDAEATYWNLYDSLEDAVSDHGDGTTVHRLEATLVGTFKRAVKVERVRTVKRKKRKAV